jgi:hypothetical protein
MEKDLERPRESLHMSCPMIDRPWIPRSNTTCSTIAAISNVRSAQLPGDANRLISWECRVP